MLLGEIERDQSYKMGEAHGTKGELKEVMIIFTLSSINHCLTKRCVYLRGMSCQ